MEKIICYLKANKKKISTMESATGGFLSSSITNIGGSSEVFQYGAVTYSNFFKIKMGVEEEVISKYSVYSMECANAMSKAISCFANSDYGVGITGKINASDPANAFGDDSTIYISLYDKENAQFYTRIVKAKKSSREKNKEFIRDEFIKLFKENIIKE